MSTTFIDFYPFQEILSVVVVGAILAINTAKFWLVSYKTIANRRLFLVGPFYCTLVELVDKRF